MAKRTASSDLNHLNWNEEDEPEDAGLFQKAPEEVLKKRVIKTARRQNLLSRNTETPSSNLFGSFSGFSSKPAPATSTAFSFLTNINKDKESAIANGTNMFVMPKATNSPLFKIDDKKEEKAKNDDFLAEVKSLNESVSNWIKLKVDQNPYVDLQPIFKDYKKYFEDLKKDSDNKNDNSKTDNSKPDFSTFSFKPTEVKDKSDSTKLPFPFGSGNQSKSNEKETENEPPKTSLFSVGKDAEKKPTFPFGVPSKDAEPPKFTFDMSAPTSTSTFPFRSNISTTSANSYSTLGTTNNTSFRFSNMTKPATTTEEENKNEEEDEEPPKNEFTPVVEDGHIYTSRCKVFVKNDGKFGDRGVGTLYLKPVPDSEKVQLITRADTSLGNLLCNFILSKSIPVKRMGKKDVMLVAVPTPDSKPPPVPILLRVKSPEEADQLFTELEKHKK